MTKHNKHKILIPSSFPIKVLSKNSAKAEECITRCKKLMLMNKFQVGYLRLPFFRKWMLGRVTKRYYKDFFVKFKGGTVLEIGCGNGDGAKIIKQYFSPKRIIATDLDPRMISHAKKYVHDTSIIFEVADVAKLPYRNATFNAAFDYVALHHIPYPDWKKSLSELYRVLKPKGLIFIYDIAIESFNTLWGKVSKVLTKHPYESMYTEKEFKSYLNKVGFKTIKEDRDTRHFVIVAEK